MNTETNKTETMIPTKMLLDALKRCKRAIPSRSTIACLQCVRVSVGMIQSTDMDAIITCPVSTGLCGDQTAIVPFVPFQRALSAIGTKNFVSLSYDAESAKFTINSDAGKTIIECEPVEDYPNLNSPEDYVKSETVPDGLLEDILALQRFASKDESRPILTGTNLYNGLLSATDSYHAGWKQTGLDIGESTTFMGGYLASMDTIKTVQLDESSRIYFVSDDCTVSLRLIVGQYPNIRSLVPVPAFHGMIGETLLKSLALAEKTVVRNNQPVILDLNGECKLTAKSLDYGTHESVHDFENDCHEEIRIGFNALFLRNSLEYAGYNAGFTSPRKPATFGDDVKGALLMPVGLPA